MNLDVMVIGGGVSGTSAALALQSRGLNVGLSSAGAAGSWFWSGVASVLGPSAPLPRALSPHDFETARPLKAPALLSADARWAMLRERAPQHPYFRTSTSPAKVMAGARRSAQRLSLPLHWPSQAAVVLTDQGTTRVADGYAEGMLSLERGVEGVVLSSAQGSEAEWIAHGYRSATGAACEVQAADAEHSATKRVAILPRLDATRFEAAAERRAELREELGCDVLECAGTIDSTFGERLRHALVDAQSTLTRLGAVTDLPVRREGYWHASASCGSGPWDARALLWAGGGLVGRGTRAAWSVPWRREHQNATRSPWLAPDVAGGSEVSETLQLLLSGAIAESVWVAGAGLGGHDPASDGTAMGVALWSADRAATAIAKALGADPGAEQ